MLIGGSTLGLLGMLIGIPISSVIYRLFREFINRKAQEKECENINAKAVNNKGK